MQDACVSLGLAQAAEAARGNITQINYTVKHNMKLHRFETTNPILCGVSKVVGGKFGHWRKCRVRCGIAIQPIAVWAPKEPDAKSR